MCRWIAYSGTPVTLRELVLAPAHSLIDQSLHSRMGATTTNGDGFGMGWYGAGEEPALYRSVSPAWSDRNLRDMAGHISASNVFAHIRASTGTAIQQTNCHPFRFGRWLWMHNGLIRDFARVKRELAMSVAPSLYPMIEGSTDSELMFYLALTFGLEVDPVDAVAKMVGLVEAVGREAGTEHPMMMTLAVTDGERTWAFRYASEGKARSLFYSKNVETLREQFPDEPVFRALSEDSRLVVSEPLGELEGAWEAFPESSWCVIQPGRDEMADFRPQPPG